MDKKNLSAARKKLEEYKLSKTAGRRGSSGEVPIFTEIASDPAHETNITSVLPTTFSHFVPPLAENIPILYNLGQDLQSIHSGGDQEIKLLNAVHDSNISGPELDNSTTFAPSSPTLMFDPANNSNVSVISPFSTTSSYEEHKEHHVLTPTAQPMLFDQENPQAVYSQKLHEHFTDAGQSFPVNFFQSSPISQEYQYQQILPDTSPYEGQDFYYSQPHQQPPSPPLFFNVNGDNITPHVPFCSQETSHLNDSLVQIEEKPGDIEQEVSVQNSSSTMNPDNNYSSFREEPHAVLNEKENNFVNSEDVYSSIIPNQLNSPGSPSLNTVQFNLPQGSEHNNIFPGAEEHILTEQMQRKSPTPMSVAQDEKSKLEIQSMQRMKSVQDALEMQLEEFRRANERLLVRQSELISQTESNERNIQELRHERDKIKEETKKSLQPLNARINTLYEENQRIVKNSSDVGMELRSKLQEKSKQYEDMEHAFIIVSKSKMDLAAELDQEREKSKELESHSLSKDADIAELRTTVTKLEEKLKVEQQKDTIIHQLEDQIRHYQVQSDNLQRDLRRSNNKIERLLVTSGAIHNSVDNEQEPLAEVHPSHQHNHVHVENCQHGEQGDHSHSHDHGSGHSHSQSSDDIHDHEHDHHGHEHEDHHHHHGHDHGHVSLESGARRPSLNPEEEMKRRLHHLEWENTTFRSDLDKLAVEAKERRTFEDKLNKMSEECQKYQAECQRLEHLVVQLQGENDTIGDYITLYQSQRLALKESAREKDLQLTNLSKEREVLLKKLEELSQLLKVLKQQKLGENAGNQIHQQCTHMEATNGGEGELEGKIRNLLSEISSSSLIENFHPCAVCSGQLMNV